MTWFETLYYTMFFVTTNYHASNERVHVDVSILRQTLGSWCQRTIEHLRGDPNIYTSTLEPRAIATWWNLNLLNFGDSKNAMSKRLLYKSNSQPWDLKENMNLNNFVVFSRKAECFHACKLRGQGQNGQSFQGSKQLFLPSAKTKSLLPAGSFGCQALNLESNLEPSPNGL